MTLFKENLIKKIGKENFIKIQNVRIGLAGAGGLGSNCAMNLVRIGFKKFTIVDFDIVNEENLDRQFYFLDQVGKKKIEALKENLFRINPDLKIRMINEKIEERNIKDLFSDCDIIVECFDKVEFKTMLIQQLVPLNKFIVAVSGLAGIGNSDDIKIHRLNKNLIIIGDLESDIKQKPALSPRVNIAAAKQADVILEYVINNAVP